MDSEQRREPLQKTLSLRRWQLKAHSSKIAVKIYPDCAYREALTEILKSLIMAMQLNERGIIEDIDPEFLHNYRVAVRRIRSAIGQLDEVFPKELTMRMKKAFCKLGELTGKLRDCDVLLLKRNEYVNMLPSHLRPGLDFFFRKTANRRAGKLKKLARIFDSGAYNKNIKKLVFSLNNAADFPETKNSRISSLSAARSIIKKRYQKSIERGKKIDEAASGKDFHVLRIEFKKLRYSMEFFASLFNDKKISNMITIVKEFQDRLGLFNDLSVQIVEINKCLKRIQEESANPLSAEAAMNGLKALLEHERMEIRMHFKEYFHDFLSVENVGSFHDLFSD
jgi:CHAD domain-containing protein